MRFATRASSIIFISLLSGCSAFNGALQGAPNFDVSILLPQEEVDSLGTVPTMKRIPTCEAAFGAPSDQLKRDTCAKELMAMIDVRYSAFRDGLLKIIDDSNLAADIATLGLGTAGTLVPGKTTKSILAGISAGISGTKGFVNSDVLYNASVVIVINQMDTDRANYRCLILTQLKNPAPGIGQPPPPPTTLTLTTTTTIKSANGAPVPSAATKPVAVNPAPPATYSMIDASSDLIQFYEAGTFAHALQALEAKTGSQVTNSKQQVTNVKTANTAAANATGSSGDTAGPGSSNATCSSS